MRISREVKTAVLVIAGLVFIIFLYNYLKGENLLDSSRKFYAVFDNVEGLGTSAPVTINGLTVGKVQEINFDDETKGKLKVTLLVDNDFEFSKNSTAELYENGLIGGKAIAIVPVNDNAPTAESGDKLTSVVKPGLSELLNQRLTPLQEKIELVMLSANDVLSNINDVFDDETKANLRNSIAQLNATITSFENTSKSINTLVTENQEKLDNTLTNVSAISDNLTAITDSIANANLAQTIKNLESTVGNFDQLLAGIENGEGSLGKLLKDEGLYNNLEGASLQLEQLLEDMKLNPKRYVHFSLFGKKPAPYEEENPDVNTNNND